MAEPTGRLDRSLLALFIACALLVVVDVATDFTGALRALHIGLELAASALAATGAAVVWSRSVRERRDLRAALDKASLDVVRSRAEVDRWRAESRTAVEGLSAAIDLQFDRWALSAAERAVGSLLLKGLSHKEIAAVLGKSERTTRQQALAIYKKGSLAGRAELSAFFLEDLLK